MRGKDGMILVVFGLFVAIARQWKLPIVRRLDDQTLQIAYLSMIFGLAVVTVRLLGRVLAAAKE